MKICNNIIQGGIIFLIIFTPLAMGARHVWAYSLMELTVTFLLLVWLLNLLLTSQESRVIPGNPIFQSSESRLLFLPIFLFLCLILLQTVPLSPSVIKYLSPNTYNLYKQTIPWYDKNQKSEGKGQKAGLKYSYSGHTTYGLQTRNATLRSISIYCYATKTELFKILAYMGVFFLIINNIKTGARIKRIVIAIMLVGCFEAFYGLVEYLSRHQHIFLFKKKYYTDCVTGTYINRNHFAGYLEMVIPLTLGYFLSQRSPVINRKSKSWRYHLSTVDTRLSINSLLIFAVIIMILALIFSQSRMGILSLLSSMGFMALMLISSSKRKGRRILSFIFTVTLILIFWGAWIGLDPVMKRFSVVSQNWTSESGRLAVWKDTVNLIKDFPILGTGLGTYEHIFPKYKTFTSRNVYKHAHNDYMEFLSEAGLIGFIIIFGGVGFYMIKIIGKWRERRDPFVKGITLGGLSALVSLLFHSITDFNLHIPANAMLLAVIMGLTFSSVNLRRSEA